MLLPQLHRELDTLRNTRASRSTLGASKVLAKSAVSFCRESWLPVCLQPDWDDPNSYPHCTGCWSIVGAVLILCRLLTRFHPSQLVFSRLCETLRSMAVAGASISTDRLERADFHFAPRLRRERITQRYTWTSLGREAHVDPRTIKAWEAETHVPFPDSPALANVARALNVETAWLLIGTRPKRRVDADRRGEDNQG